MKGDRDGKSAKTSIVSYPGRLQTRKNGLVSTVCACAKTPRFVHVQFLRYMYIPHTHVYIPSNHARIDYFAHARTVPFFPRPDYEAKTRNCLLQL